MFFYVSYLNCFSRRLENGVIMIRSYLKSLLKMGELQSNSFSTMVGYGLEPVEISNARIASIASTLRTNFGNAIDLLQ